MTIQYKENTPVFSYYIIKSILLFHFNEFIGWCNENNSNNIITNNIDTPKLDTTVEKEVSIISAFKPKLKNIAKLNELNITLINSIFYKSYYLKL